MMKRANILHLVRAYLAITAKREPGWTAALGDRVEIMLPSYRGITGAVVNLSETLGFGPTCVVRIEGSSEMVQLPCISIKVMERKPAAAPADVKKVAVKR